MSEIDLQERLNAMEARLTRLEDMEAIRRLKCEHALASDDHEHLAERFVAIVTDDFEADYGEGFGTVRGKDELREFLRASPFSWTMHYMIPKRIDVAADGRTATGVWYLWEPAAAQNASATQERAVWLAGVYEDSYCKQADGGWKIGSIKFTATLLVPYVRGWEGERIVAIDFAD
ncbi:nuclear transport factor 2 family protein (plasmid) [Sphingobium sp. SJ10-10]|uniref:nuclear transport factor 2 family protein n=1 Tax=Sphingobium sp. SJ10-10 TaxID=3114999 RepID=UPI002E16D05F|nr:nuclear transport factor 2 family protein [Sphingobium sp. SJ10-10]